MRNVILYTHTGETWIVICPGLPNCNAQGKTKQEALTNMRQVVQEYVDALKREGKPVPKDTGRIWLDRV
jgi:predicted RNase H-like HicB family nuclease